MKTLFTLLFSALLGSAAMAQTGKVTINVKGNRTTQIAIDDQYYTVNNSSSTSERTFTVSSLGTGSHSLEIVRRGNTYNATNSINTSFNLRSGYDLTITVATNGSVSMSETRAGYGNAGNAVTANQYNRIYSQARNRTGSTARASYLENEFTNTNRMYTSQQASNLIQLVNSESSRFNLAKLSYTRVTDRENFSLVSSLLNSTYNRQALNEYIASVGYGNEGNNTGTPGVAMTDARFNVIYNELQAEQGSSSKNYYLSNFFNKTYNYYSSYQARQLIAQVSTEAERFYLTKVAYRGITDPANYYAQVASLLSSSSNRAQLSAYINSYNNNNNTGGTTGVAVSAATFNNLYQSAYNQSSFSARYASVNAAFNTNGYYFTAAQARQLIQLINDENSRLQLSKNAYRVLVDRNNYTQLSELLNTMAARNNLRDYVNSFDDGYPGGIYTNKVPMTSTEFNNIKRDVQYTFGLGAKMSALTRIFNNESNYFTAQQARELIELVSAESNRLELAKLAYNNLTDAGNYTVINEVFSSQSSKDEYNSWVTANAYLYN